MHGDGDGDGDGDAMHARLTPLQEAKLDRPVDAGHVTVPARTPVLLPNIVTPPRCGMAPPAHPILLRDTMPCCSTCPPDPSLSLSLMPPGVSIHAPTVGLPAGLRHQDSGGQDSVCGAEHCIGQGSVGGGAWRSGTAIAMRQPPWAPRAHSVGRPIRIPESSKPRQQTCIHLRNHLSCTLAASQHASSCCIASQAAPHSHAPCFTV